MYRIRSDPDMEKFEYLLQARLNPRSKVIRSCTNLRAHPRCFGD